MPSTARHLATSVAVVTTAGAVLASPLLTGTASAAPTFPVSYNAVGSTHIAKTNSSIPLGPAVLAAKLKPSGAFTATLPLPPASTSFKVLGLVPISATVTFIPVGKITGALTSKGSRTAVSTTAKFTVNLSNVKTAGIPTPVGSSCQTAAPVTLKLKTPAGESFNVVTGGNVTGTYTIGDFANCGLTTGLINLLIPGPDNTASLALTSVS